MDFLEAYDSLDYERSIFSWGGKWVGNINNLHEHPKYNDILKLIILYNEDLTHFQENLPESLEHLQCSANKNLTHLPENLPASLTYLDCSGNDNLTHLPENLPASLEYLDCSENKNLTSIPENLPASLTHLDCTENDKITSLPENLPASLEYLDCSENKNLTRLPENLPASLTHLECVRNDKLTRIPNLPISLEHFECSMNPNLTHIPDHLPDTLTYLSCVEIPKNNLIGIPKSIPKSLTFLDCSDNENFNTLIENQHLPLTLTRLEISFNNLTHLPVNIHAMATLTQLDISNNNITHIPENLPASLEHLNCTGNPGITRLPDNLPRSLIWLECYECSITTLPVSLIECTRLKDFRFTGNPIEHIPPIVVRLVINRIELRRHNNNNNNNTIYNDSQNVHNHSIQESIRASVYSLLSDDTSHTGGIDQTLSEILSSEWISDEAKAAIAEFITSDDSSEHYSAMQNITFADILIPVWNRIKNSETSSYKELAQILSAEMVDSRCVCFTGRVSRLVNVLAGGFFKDISVKISDAEQIANVIAATAEGDELATYSVEKHRERAEKELTARGFTPDVISKWISGIE